jgi:hypothetical protein
MIRDTTIRYMKCMIQSNPPVLRRGEEPDARLPVIPGVCPRHRSREVDLRGLSYSGTLHSERRVPDIIQILSTQ